MSEFNRSEYYSYTGDTLKAYINKVLLRMGTALAVTGAVAFGLYLSLMREGFFFQVLVNYYTPVLVVVSIAQIALCLVMGTRLTSLKAGTCTALFYGYAALTGITFSVLPLSFGAYTVFQAFLYAAIMFMSCAVIGHTTDIDLTRFRGMLFGGLIALLVATIASIFIPILRESLLISYFGVILFLGYTAYDMQRIKAFYYQADGYGAVKENLAIYGAFQLYLDFINLFLRILTILSRNRNSRR